MNVAGMGTGGQKNALHFIPQLDVHQSKRRHTHIRNKRSVECVRGSLYYSGPIFPAAEQGVTGDRTAIIRSHGCQCMPPRVELAFRLAEFFCGWSRAVDGATPIEVPQSHSSVHVIGASRCQPRVLVNTSMSWRDRLSPITGGIRYSSIRIRARSGWVSFSPTHFELPIPTPDRPPSPILQVPYLKPQQRQRFHATYAFDTPQAVNCSPCNIRSDLLANKTVDNVSVVENPRLSGMQDRSNKGKRWQEEAVIGAGVVFISTVPVVVPLEKFS
ncbi:hypothetical protein BD779DRAFT_1588135 [Infundibulicybe gibba]|nr:hypothetical protein BD779DRAFT_1588135 [Infundibulicybe gibba]